MNVTIVSCVAIIGLPASSVSVTLYVASSPSVIFVLIPINFTFTFVTVVATARVGPDSTGIVLIDSLKFSQILVSAIPFNESSIEEKIELNVEPFPIALPAPAPGPAAAASRDSINV